MELDKKTKQGFVWFITYLLLAKLYGHKIAKAISYSSQNSVLSILGLVVSNSDVLGWSVFQPGSHDQKPI